MPYTEPTYPTTTSTLAQNLSGWAEKVASSTPTMLEVFGHSNTPILGYTLGREMKALIYHDYAQGGSTIAAQEGGRTGTGPWGSHSRVIRELDRRWHTDPAQYLFLAQSELVLMCWGQNDLPSYGPLAASTDAIKHAYRTAICGVRQSVRFEAEDSGANNFMTFTGSGWSIDPGFFYGNASGTGGGRLNNTVNDTFTIAVPSWFAGGRVCIGFMTQGDGTGADWRIATDGGAEVQWDTRSITAFDYGSTRAATGQHMLSTWRSPILSSGTHTIIGRVNALTLANSFVDYWAIEPDPAVVPNCLPLVLVMSNLRPQSWAFWNSYPYNIAAGLTDTDLATVETAIQSVIAEFVDADATRVVYLNGDAALNKQAKYFNADGIHMNPYGAGVLTELALDAIQDRLDLLPRGYIAAPYERMFQKVKEREGFSNSWVDDGAAGTAPAGYRRDLDGKVYVRGAVKSGSSATAAVFTLRANEGYRPRYDVEFPINGNGTAGIGMLTSAGVLNFVAGGSTTRTTFNFSYYGED